LELAVFLKALVLGLVEGTTEFLPVSSTGHLIIFGELLNFDEEYSEVFDISIQTGALLAVVSYYKKEVLDMFLLKDVNLIRKLFLSFLPIGILGLLFGEHILDYLFQPFFVGLAFIFGAILMIHVEKYHVKELKGLEDIKTITYKVAFKIGLLQSLALIPGFSRSGAAMIGGMYFGLGRSLAAKYSFILAIPVIFFAGIYSVVLKIEYLSYETLNVFLVGFFAAFLSAFFAIHILLRYLRNHSLIAFAYYRIVVGIFIIILG
jgi:undecaprenyl-diphosphatase